MSSCTLGAPLWTAEPEDSAGSEDSASRCPLRAESRVSAPVSSRRAQLAAIDIGPQGTTCRFHSDCEILLCDMAGRAHPTKSKIPKTESRRTCMLT